MKPSVSQAGLHRRTQPPCPASGLTWWLGSVVTSTSDPRRKNSSGRRTTFYGQRALDRKGTGATQFYERAACTDKLLECLDVRGGQLIAILGRRAAAPDRRSLPVQRSAPESSAVTTSTRSSAA